MPSRLRIALLTTIAMTAFAANSLLCRVALRGNEIDAATFTAIRLAAGATLLFLLLKARSREVGGDWVSATALFTYAAAFSFAYLSLSAGTGALLLFAAVQLTMITAGLKSGEGMSALQGLGGIAAFGGLVFLVLPGISAPPVAAAGLMVLAGAAWGLYSLRGKDAPDAIAATAGNFIRATPGGLVLVVIFLRGTHCSIAGATYALVSGAVTSGLGYVVWYAVLPKLKSTTAATVQLSAPVIAAIGGTVLLREQITMRIIVGGIAVLGGIGLVFADRGRPSRPGKDPMVPPPARRAA